MIAIVIRIVIFIIIIVVSKKRVVTGLVDDHDVKTCVRDIRKVIFFVLVFGLLAQITF